MATTATPRDTLAQIAQMYGYDPATIVSVKMEPNETIFTYRLADPATAGKYQITDDGYLITPSALAVLRAIAGGYGYDPDAIVSVKISQYESIVKYNVPLGDGTSLLQVDNFSIAGAAPIPAAAPAATGVPYGSTA